ncbi:DUF4864 domain-containing protein [Halorubrum rutilum]|uniref:DUF4864 domain-containing protein n=1 Tax=Halorubrum rutilum TaxID=1364933 RepID=A0ABD6APM2_9EURY|nr:DUF4864 domain-containing protein [Halorubrum rutilum]
MTAPNHIPYDTFAEAIASLDRESLAALVGETYAVTADEVRVDGPRLTVVEHDRRTELLVVSGPDDLDSSEGYDTVVTARDSLLADHPLPADTAVMTPADLRQRLLYAIAPDDADTITTEFLDAPMRSPAYDTSSAADTPTDHDPPSNDDDTPVATETGPQNTPRSTPGDPLGESPPIGTASTAQRADASPDDSPSQPSRSQSSDAPSSEVLPNGNRRWILVGVIGLGVLLGLAAVGAGIAGDAFITGGDGVAGVDDGTPTDPDSSESGPPDSNTTNDGGDTAALDRPADRNLTTATARTTSVAPTCERSAIHVVQLQMNAFRYNNNTTNTGILTARQFASPSNRAAVGSADQFISLFDMPQYAPLLTYDSVEYSVPSADGDITTIDVVTRENGTVTGRYDFRLKKVPSDETGLNTTRADTECWMTSGVRASPL